LLTGIDDDCIIWPGMMILLVTEHWWGRARAMDALYRAIVW